MPMLLLLLRIVQSRVVLWHLLCAIGHQLTKMATLPYTTAVLMAMITGLIGNNDFVVRFFKAV